MNISDKEKRLLKRLKLIVLLILISLLAFSQEQIGPYKVWYNYQYRMADSLTYTIVCNNTEIQRKGSFRKSTGSADPKDYRETGFDRGHLYPCDIAANEYDMYCSFDMKNVIPQCPSLNRGLWHVLEERSKSLACNNDSVVVMIKISKMKTLINEQFYVPMYLTKILYVWRDRRVDNEVYVFENSKPVYNSIFMYKVKNNR